jgi:hypothetical protein
MVEAPDAAQVATQAETIAAAARSAVNGDN